MLFPLLFLQSTALTPVVTTASRDARELTGVPSAVSIVDSAALKRTRAVHLGDALRMVPGVQAGSLYGTEDVKVQIRGAGGRGGFGVRGAAVLLDGVPLTEPDGQGRLDILDLSTAARIEVVRGPAASLYGGGAGGGVLNVLSASGRSAPGFGVRLLGGTNDLQKADATYGWARGPWDALGSFDYTGLGGYRPWSRGINRRAHLQLGWNGTAGDRVTLDGAWSNLDQRIPGTLLLSEVNGPVGKADSLNVANAYSRREERWRLALSSSSPIAAGRAGTLDSYVVASGRANEQAIFQYIKQIQQRWQAGTRYGVSGTSGGTLFRFSAAADADRAAGPQTNWTNSRGAPVVTTLCVNDVAAGITSTPCVRQDATLWSLGVSSQAEATRGDWSLSVGSRWDDVRIDVANRIRPTQSIAKRWTQLSPKVALTWRAQPTWTWWASLARGFDPPTATELTTSPDTLKGFNDALAPASQWQWELGTRGVTPRGISYEATGFVADVRNDFVSRTVAIPGVAQPRAYFENAARARRTGIELGASAPLSSAWRVGATYTWSHFVFTDFKGTLTGPTFSADSVNYVGRAVPGIAPHRATVEARWQPEGPIAVTLWGEYNAKTYVDFANTDSGLVYLRTSPLTRPAAGRAIPFTAMPASALLHASMTWRLRDAALLFTADNLLNSKWISSASLNATNGKFYFPGPGRTISFGMSLGTLRP